MNVRDVEKNNNLNPYFLAYNDGLRREFQREHDLNIREYAVLCYIHYKSMIQLSFTNYDLTAIEYVNNWVLKFMGMFEDRGWIKITESSELKFRYVMTRESKEAMIDLYKKHLQHLTPPEVKTPIQVMGVDDLVVRGDLNYHFLAYNDLLRRCFEARYGLDIKDYSNLCCCHYMTEVAGSFSKDDFNDVSYMNNWDSNKMDMYIRKGWIGRIDSYGRKHRYAAKYTLKKMMVSLYHKHLGKEFINTSSKRNPLVRDDNYYKSIMVCYNDKDFTDWEVK